MINNKEIEELILSLLQEKFDKQSLVKFQPLQWNQIKQKLSYNPVSLIIYSILKKQDSLDILPQDLRETWQAAYHNNLKKNILVLEQIKSVQGMFKNKGVGCILLKGASLISTVYKDLGVRSFVDIDVLVKKCDLPLVKQSFSELGYVLMMPDSVGFLEEFGAGELLFKKPGMPHFDIHWDLSFYERFRGIIRFDNAKIWQEALTVNFDNTDITVLNPETQILYISAHLALAHSFQGLTGFFDLASLIKFYRTIINWDKLIKDATRIGIKIPVYYALKFTRDFFDIFLPTDLLKQLAPSSIRLKILNSLINKEKALGLDRKYEETRYFAQTLMMDKPQDIIKVGLRALFPSKAWLFYRYGRNNLFSLRMKHLLKLMNLFIKFLYYLTLRGLFVIVK
ncbi:MAG: nucleotidyltransferase family protein [Candidatus Omnitrophica bacterium]|nr:nucleotidyltransferase family protein [Candidatus Omnitrophota bacterium]